MLLVTAKQFWITFWFFSNISKTTECVRIFQRKTSWNGICFRSCPQKTSRNRRLWQFQIINIIIQAAKPTSSKSTSKKRQKFRFRRWFEIWNKNLWKKVSGRNSQSQAHSFQHIWSVIKKRVRKSRSFYLSPLSTGKGPRTVFCKQTSDRDRKSCVWSYLWTKIRNFGLFWTFGF